LGQGGITRALASNRSLNLFVLGDERSKLVVHARRLLPLPTAALESRLLSGTVAQLLLKTALALDEIRVDPLPQIDAGFGEILQQGPGSRLLTHFESRRRQSFLGVNSVKVHEDVYLVIVFCLE
jgi:hypothetical protein